MPAGRPPKRPSDALDSAIDSPPGGSSSSSKIKLPRLERGPEDFSSVVKNKLQSYSRTGQACDRCKVRKIRCDALPEGCSHCINQNLDCYVTDRVTGRTERRGYMQQLEREKTDMMTHIRDLEKLLKDNGVQVRSFQGAGAGQGFSPGVAYDAMGSHVVDAASKDQWAQMGSVWVNKTQLVQQRAASSDSPLPPALDGRPVDAHLGVAMDNAPLSSVKGTQLSILGTTIDITCFDAPDLDGPTPGTPNTAPLYNKSIQAFLNSALKINPSLDVPLPSRDEAFAYAEWYFIMVHPFLPVLHKPSFFTLLSRTYDDPSFKPPTSELVVVHMVFSTMYYQFGVRNDDEPAKKAQLNDLSNKHYHWCIDKVYDLASDNGLSCLQALAMLASHSRSFPKPGPATLITALALQKAIEFNYHRSQLKKGEPTNLLNEMRKRNWWTILMVCTTLNGRLGRPMPIKVEDFDTELPIAIPDECLTDEGITDPSRIGECSWTMALCGYKVVPIFIDMFASIFCARSDPKRYLKAVQRLEESIRTWQNELPDEVIIEKCKSGGMIYALYTEATRLEFILCLRHPSVCLSTDPAFRAECTRKSEDAAKKLLRIVANLVRLKSVDTTWYQVSVYVAAIFTILAAAWERRIDTTPPEIVTLREDMSVGLHIVTELASYIGSGSQLVQDVTNIVNRTIAWIEHDMGRKAGSNMPTPQLQSQAPQLVIQSVKQDSYAPQSGPQQQRQVSATRTPTPTPNGTLDQGQIQRAHGMGNSPFYSSSMAPSPAYPQLAYSEAAHGGISTPNPGVNNLPPTYDSNESAHQYLYAASAAAAAMASTSVASPEPLSSNHLTGYAGQTTQHAHNMSHQGGAAGTGGEWSGNNTHTHAHAHAHAMHHSGNNNANNPWHDWTTAIMDPASQDRYSANALLTLGDPQRDGVPGMSSPEDANAHGPGVPSGHNAGASWPMVLFHDGSVSGG